MIAGYHWFTDWGRDTMISLDGTRCVLTGPPKRAASCSPLLATCAMKAIPNLFPEGGQGLHHTADATLWFFHAIDRYVTVTNDGDTLRDLLPALDEVVQKHRAGTRFGIRMDDDGLLAGCGESGAHLDGCQSWRVGRDASPW